MKLIAMEIENVGVTAEQFEPHLIEEARTVWGLQQQGLIREVYFREDQHTAVLILECEDVSHAQSVLALLPLVRHALIHFDIIPLAPYSGYSRLFVSSGKT